jgi:hypothetical protein
VTTAPTGTRELDHYLQLDELEERFKQVDIHLEAAVETLFRVAEFTKAASPDQTIPAWFSETDSISETYPLCHAIVCATLQKVWRQRRRFSYIKEDDRTKEVIAWLPTPFLAPENVDDLSFVAQLGSRAFGALNPLTASQVLRVLLQTGEAATISPLGALSLFAILWALNRRHGEKADAGVALDPWRPTAAITAKCVFVVESLLKNCDRRAALLEDIGAALNELSDGRDVQESVYARWRFCLLADRIATHLQTLAEMADAKNEIHEQAVKIADAVASLEWNGPKDAYEKAWTTIERSVREGIHLWRRKVLEGIRDSRPVTETLLPRIVTVLKTNKVASISMADVSADERADRIRAAEVAKELCREHVGTMRDSLKGAMTEPVLEMLRRAADGYRITARSLEKQLEPAIRWSQIVVRDQIAHASAQNYTDFDPAEMVSAIAVSRLSATFSALESRDAIEKSRLGMRPDGSWMRGQPIYLHERVLGVWPSTPDIVWVLCAALDRTPEVDASAVLQAFVDWAERNQTNVHRDGLRLKGWSSELSRDDRTVDVWTTAVIANALLEIRQILERTARDLCERRFTVVPLTTGLDGIDPVDLGAVHEKRLHRLLSTAVRETQRAEKDAMYSFVFHGPPGSSKTAVSNAMARDMWEGQRGDGLLIRITPADFTRLGSDRLDSEARYIFRLLSRTRRVTVLFDEIDDLLRVRDNTPPTFFNLVVPAMLNRLQDLRDAAPRQEICFAISTNYVDRIEPALIRRGRIDRAIPVPYPDFASRMAILQKPDFVFDEALARDIATRAAGQPWAELIRAAKMVKKGTAPDKVLVGSLRARDVNQYYLVKERWGARSDPLENELIHVIASRNELQVDNETVLLEVADEIKFPADEISEYFKAVCAEEQR